VRVKPLAKPGITGAPLPKTAAKTSAAMPTPAITAAAAAAVLPPPKKEGETQKSKAKTASAGQDAEKKDSQKEKLAQFTLHRTPNGGFGIVLLGRTKERPNLTNVTITGFSHNNAKQSNLPLGSVLLRARDADEKSPLWVDLATASQADVRAALQPFKSVILEVKLPAELAEGKPKPKKHNVLFCCFGSPPPDIDSEKDD
jgi:hypothetical protein